MWGQRGRHRERERERVERERVEREREPIYGITPEILTTTRLKLQFRLGLPHE